MAPTQRTSMRALVIVSLLAPSAALAAPLRGDPVHGEELYRMECAACHGADGSGSALWRKASANKGWNPLPDLSRSAFMVTRSDVQLVNTMRKGSGLEGKIPYHAISSLGRLDAWDIVAYLRHGDLRVTDFHPEAAKFTAHEFTIDEFGQKRLKDNLKIALTDDETKVVVITAYSGKKVAQPRLVKWIPVELDLLEAKARLGHLTFIDLVPPGEKAPVTVGFAFGLDGKLSDVHVRLPPGKRRDELEKVLSSFVGQGTKSASAFKAPRGVRGADRWAPLVTRAAARAAEGIVMFDKAERERTIFDR